LKNTPVGASGSTVTIEVSTPKAAMRARTSRPSGSSPTRLAQAARAPSMAR
jgi:hypothetical protein